MDSAAVSLRRTCDMDHRGWGRPRQPSCAAASVASTPHETSHARRPLPVSSCYFSAWAQRQALQPLSNTTFQLPSLSRRQIELKVATRSPFALSTGPLLCASFPESSTSTVSELHENGALGFSYRPFQLSTTAALPRAGVSPPKKIASSAIKVAKALWSRAAIVAAKA